jgi:hypothetical protein
MRTTCCLGFCPVYTFNGTHSMVHSHSPSRTRERCSGTDRYVLICTYSTTCRTSARTYTYSTICRTSARLPGICCTYSDHGQIPRNMQYLHIHSPGWARAECLVRCMQYIFLPSPRYTVHNTMLVGPGTNA